MSLCLCLICALLWHGGAAAVALPVFSDSGPDAAVYGAAQNYPIARSSNNQALATMIGTFSHYDEALKSGRLSKAAVFSPLRRAAEELKLTYTYAGADYSLADYLNRNPATGLLIAHDDEIVFEHYQYARTDRDRLVSQSMVKTITALLVGIAVTDGAIRSIDQPAADYVPELAGTEYGKTPIRALLHMSSGVKYVETYDGNDDSAKLNRALFGPTSRGPAKALATFDFRDAPPGTRFYYAGAETETLGLVVRNAVHMSLADYAQQRIWQPLGAESDATWLRDAAGYEVAYCCFSATLRDWARVGLMLAHDGAWNGKQIVPREWILRATSVASLDEYLAPGRATPFYGYGYQVWLLPGPRREFALLGIHGQAIFVDPAAHLVLVHTAVRVKPNHDPAAAELVALWRAVVKRFVASAQTPASLPPATVPQ
jgi:CubicO group peptidase (beta-lactamase class C family)